MPNLKCNALCCSFNQGEYCTRSTIKVGGNLATTNNETCCTSYKEKKRYDDSLKTEFASFDSISPSVSIECESRNCKYNRANLCCSTRVDIKGKNAHYLSETSCATFSRL